MYAIETNNLSRSFGSVIAVDRISLEIPRGIVFGFLGPNGAGKTTTIRLLLGLLDPTLGSAQVLGYDTRTQGDEVRQRCGALLEHNGLYERLSAEDNLDFYGRVWRMPKADREARTKELLNHFGLWKRRKDKVAKWSRGMKQKLAVGRALFHHPELVFLDEPTAGLDPLAAVALRDDLASLAEREGVTIFLTTHNLAEAEKLCHQVGVIREGKLLAVGTMDELRERTGAPRLEINGSGFTSSSIEKINNRPEVANVRLENDHLMITFKHSTSAAPLIKLLVDEGVQIEEARKANASLEETFLALMNGESEGEANS